MPNLTNGKFPEELGKLNSLLESHPLIQFARLQWVDYSGILRARIVTIDHLKRLLASKKPLRSGPISFCILSDNSRLHWNPYGFHLQYPDWNSTRVVRLGPRDTQYLNVMCSVVGHSAGDPTPDRGLCPRIALQNLIEKARKEQNLDFLIGFEMEFTLLRESTDGTLLPFSSQPGCYSVAGLRDPTFHLVEECIRGLCTAGIQIEGFHVEGYTGQYEIALAPQPPLEAIDTWVTTHDLIKSFFSNHGYVATMCPKPIGGDQANGAHTHVSISQPEKQPAFLAGILQRLPALWSFFMPQKVSYVRRLNGQAGETVRWGTKNRMAPGRKLGEGYWEFRCVDAIVNMYLVVAAIIAAGLAGIMDGTHLRWPDVSIESEQSAEEVELPVHYQPGAGTVDKGV